MQNAQPTYTPIKDISSNPKTAFRLSTSQKATIIREYADIVDRILVQHFGLTTQPPLVFNNRLRSAIGKYRMTVSYRTHEVIKESIDLQTTAMALSFLDDPATGSAFRQNVMAHELVHYAMYKLGKNANDGSADFEQALADLHIMASGRTNQHRVISDTDLVYYSRTVTYEREGQPEQISVGNNYKRMQRILDNLTVLSSVGKADNIAVAICRIACTR